jgi:hypothetical protein
MDWKYWLGLGVAIIGVLYAAAQYHRGSRVVGRSGSSIAISAILALIACIAVGFDYADRHRSGMPSKEEWQKEINDLKTVTGDLTNRTVPMDGYKFTDCQLGNTILIYEGKRPTSVNCVVAKGGVLTLQSDNPAVEQALAVLDMLNTARGGPIMCKPTNPDVPLLPE